MTTHERSAGVIVFYRPPIGGIEYLLLDYGKHWDFPKGHLEEGESDEAAARRELAEETGIAQIILLPGFSREIAYFFRHRRRGLVRKVVVFFLGELVERPRIALSQEHVGEAFLPYDSAIKRVTYAGAKQVLKDAHAFLENRNVAK